MLKHEINSVAKLWTQYNCNFIFEINVTMIDVLIFIESIYFLRYH